MAQTMRETKSSSIEPGKHQENGSLGGIRDRCEDAGGDACDWAGREEEVEDL